MKILHIISSCNPEGGGPIEGVKQFNYFYKKRSIHAEILCSDSPNAKFIKDKRLPKVNALGSGLLNYSYNPKLFKWLEKNINKFDCIIVNGIWQYHAYAAWKIATKNKIPYYIFTHGMLDPWFNHTYKIKYLKKIIYWLLFQYRILRDAQNVFFTSIEEKILARKSFKPYHVKEKVIGYGTKNIRYNFNNKNNLFKKKFSKISEKKIILFLGRIAPKKGLEILLPAFQNIDKDNVHLLIIGPYDINYKKKLTTLVDKLNLKNFVTFEKAIYGKLKWDTINSCNIFCLPSHQENFGISVVESLMCKKPVLITNKVNIWREIKKANAGFVNNDNIEGVTKNLKKWINMNKNEYKKISKNAYNCFENNFNLEKTSYKLINFIKANK